MAPFTPEVLPADYRKSYDALSEAAKAAWLEQRLKGQIDHLFLARELIGGALGDFQETPHRSLFQEFLQKDPEQKKALYELDQKTKKRMILWPRGVFKTSSTIIEMVQLILNFPNIRILILSGSKPLAKAQLKAVKRVFEKPTQKFQQLYPEFCGDKLGDSQEFTVPCRTMEFLQPTVCISSAKSVKAGSHFDVIFVDDLVNDQNYKNIKALEKCFQEYLDIGPLLEPAGFMFVTGTRYSFGDTYEKIREQAEKDQKELGKSVWKISIRSCWSRICTCGHPELRHNSDLSYSQPPCTYDGCSCTCFVDSGQKYVLFPLAITKDGREIGQSIEFLESVQREDAEFFSCQYENNPIPAGQQAFTPELIAKQTFFHLSVIPPEAGTFMVGDLSYIGQEDRDMSVLYLVKVWLGLLWVYDCIWGKWDSDQAAANIITGILQHRPQAVWIEGFLGWEAYDNIIRSKAQGIGLQQLPLSWIKMVNKKNAKIVRIGGVVSWLKQGKLWLFAGMPQYDTLCGQLKKWPKVGKRRDYADCLGLACEAPHGAALLPAPPPNYSTIDHIRQMHAEQRARAEAERFGEGGTGTGIVSG